MLSHGRCMGIRRYTGNESSIWFCSITATTWLPKGFVVMMPITFSIRNQARTSRLLVINSSLIEHCERGHSYCQGGIFCCNSPWRWYWMREDLSCSVCRKRQVLWSLPAGQAAGPLRVPTGTNGSWWSCQKRQMINRRARQWNFDEQV